MKTYRHQFFFIITFFAVTASAQPTIYIVRHAEKLAAWLEDDAMDSFHPLSTEGIGRAQKLTEQFKPEAIAAIFSSRTTRALHTALPLSQKLNLPVEAVEACMDTNAITAFYKNLAQRFGPDKSVVLVSHSNIIPYLLLKAGLPQSCFKEMRLKPAAPTEWLLIEGYDNIWQVKKLASPQKNCNDFLRKIF